MCGLFGTTLPTLNDEEIDRARKARDTLTHRGPNQSGEWIEDNIYTGHRRLSIMDLSDAGRQPMITADKKIGITVNGEIYNYRELKIELESAGYIFQSKSDSEVALHGYQHWGLDTLAKKLDGMYVVVIHDRVKNEIYAIRDRVGIKPLYYYHEGKHFSWGSELKSLQKWLPEDKLKTDKTALMDFIVYRYIPAPKSLYRNIYKLEAAHILRFKISTGKLTTSRYWSLPISDRQAAQCHSDKIFHLLKKSVQSQMISDVPIGFLLSGGIDSSAITMMGSRLSDRPHAFSIGFNNPEHDESRYAKELAEVLDVQHYVKKLDQNDMSNLSDKMRQWFDEPFGDTSAIPTFEVCRFARQHVTVALSGDGGDELFGGYSWYNKYLKSHLLSKFIPSFLDGSSSPRWIPKQTALDILTTKDPLEQYGLIRSKISLSDINLWKKRLEIDQDYDYYWAYRKHYHPETGVRKSAQIMDFHTYLPDDILTKVDRVSMSVSLECRPPFLSQELVECAFSIHESDIYQNNALKGALKNALSAHLPKDLFLRKKRGFSMPDDGWKKKTINNSINVQEHLLKNFL